jgi:hypothetical protein
MRTSADAEGVVGFDVLSRECRHVREGLFAHPREHGAAFGGGDVDLLLIRHGGPFGRCVRRGDENRDNGRSRVKRLDRPGRSPLECGKQRSGLPLFIPRGGTGKVSELERACNW